MAVFHHILVATDFSHAAEAALNKACDLARQLSATLTIVHVQAPPVNYGALNGMYWTDPDIEAHAARALSEVGEAARRRGTEPETVLAIGSACDEILRIAQSRDVDLIVVGTHGRSGIARAILGSVAEKIVRSSVVPVLALHAEKSAEAATAPVPEAGAARPA